MEVDNLGDDGVEPRSNACNSKRKRVISEGPNKMRRTHRSIIVMIRMKNFLSYEDHYVYPGPKLNLILGVNGAGKSTINNAICIGLGFDAKLLDRGKDVGDFVKRGENKGFVEIHLSQPNKHTIVVKAHLDKEKRNASFELGGKSASKKEVVSFCRGLGINLDNLCHFLPQEKVLAFANLAGKPSEMLQEVEKAVGPEQMKKDHDTLIELTASSSSRINEFENLKQELGNLRTQEQELQAELVRFERYQELEKQVLRVGWKRLFVESAATKRRFKDKEREHEEAYDRCMALDTQWNASKEREEDAKRAFEDARNAKGSTDQQLHAALARIDEQQQQQLDLEREGTSAAKQIAGLEQKKRQLDEEIRRKEEEAAQVRAARDGHVVPPDMDQRIRAATEALSRTSGERRKLQDEEGKHRQRLQESAAELESVERQCERLHNIRRQKETALQNANPALYRAFKFVESRQNEFDQTVYGPVMLDIEVDKQEDAAYVEHCLGVRILEGFITQNEHDFKLLHSMMDVANSPVKRITVFKCDGSPRVPTTTDAARQVLRGYGVDRLLIDSVRAPEAVMSVLTNSGALDQAFVGSAEAFERYDKVLEDERLKHRAASGKWQHVLGKGCFTPKGRFYANFSIHGRQSMLQYAEDYRRAARLVVGDAKQLEELSRQRQKLQTQRTSAEEEVAKVQRQLEQMGPAVSEKQQELHDLKEQKNKRSILDRTIKQLESLVADKRKQDPTKARPRLERAVQEATDKMMQNAEAMLAKVREASALQRKLQALELRLQPLQNRSRELRAAAQEQGQALVALKHEVNALAQERTALKKECEAARKRKKEAVPELTAELREQLDMLPQSEEELEAAEDAAREEMGRLGIAIDRKVEYETVQNKIGEVASEIDKRKDSIENLQANINKYKERWLNGDAEGVLYPQPVGGLRQLIGIINREFSETFETMGNVGEVRLGEAKTEGGEDDFARYSVEIMVKFRKTQALQRLDGHVQSGGETSLSTMLFLVALQQVTEAPFRVVDEINQGMDQQYEKAVFDRIVKWSCRENTSQTFLITPKLAPGLLDQVETENDDDMRVTVACKGIEVALGGEW